MPGEPRDGGLLQALLKLVVARPVAVSMVVLALLVFGALSFLKLPVDLLPQIGYPTLTVRTTWPGAAPEDVEDRVSRRLQEALSTLPRLVRATSTSRAETSDVVLDFEWGAEMGFAVQDVRDKLDGVFLPPGAEKPLILRYDPNLDPVLRLALVRPDGRGGERDLVRLRWIAEERVERELEAIPGVAAVQVRGGLEEEIRVRVDPFKMAAQKLDPALVATRLAQENLNASGGLVREGSTEYLVRTLNEFRDVEEIADLVLERRNGAPIRIRDVGVVERSHEEREVVTRLDGGEAVEVAIYREAGANIVELVDAVRAKVFGTSEERRRLAEREARGERGPPSFEDARALRFLAFQLADEARIEVLSDQSTFIRDSIEDVEDSAWIGGLLTIFVIWLALRRFPPTLVIALSIPVSVVVTFAPMHLAGVSLNIMSLGGLALGIGMIVDASIVVLESVMRRRELGDPPLEAAVAGTREVAGAVTGSTLTSIAVFAPIVFVHGVAGRIFGDQALTVVVSLVVSLVVALLVIPVLAASRFASGEPPAPAEEPPRWFDGASWRALAHWPRIAARLPGAAFFGLLRALALLVGGGARVVGWIFRPLLWLHDAGWSRVERAYPRLLGAAIDRPWLVVLLSALALAATAIEARKLGVDLLPEIHQGEFTAKVQLDAGTPLAATDAVLSEIDARVRALEGVALTAVVAGVERDALTTEAEGKHTARLTVRLDPARADPRAEDALLERVRETVASHPAVRGVEFARPTPFALEAPLEVEVLGWDLDDIRATADEVARRLAAVEGLSDVRTSLRAGNPEARIVFDREKTLEYGLDLQRTSDLVRDAVLGKVGTRFVDGDDRIDVRVLGDEFVRSDLEQVLDLVVNPTADAPVRLRDVATVEVVDGPAEIRRIGNTRAAVVGAAASGVDLGGLTSRVEAALAGLVPRGDTVVQIGGQKREMDEAQSSMRLALLFALFLVYVVMAGQFESLLQPLIILVTVPLAFVGVVWTNSALGIPLSVVVFIGLILLAGIVVANAIVLIDRINQNRASGMDVRAAVMEAGATRLRPIYMTANTTIIGLLPMTGWFAFVPWIGAMGSGPGAELRAPMAVTVVAGLSSSTVLTLVVVPAVYRLLHRRQERA